MKLIFTLFSFLLSFECLVAQNMSLAWAKNLGGTEADNGLSVAVDASGSVYTTGYFRGVADFDPGAGTFNLTSAGGADMFISKLDASGSFVWAKRIGGEGDDFGQSIAIDASGNILTTGYYSGAVDFDPGAGTLTLASGIGSNIFVNKLDASGNFVWARNLGDEFSYDYGRSVTADAAGNVYVTGSYEGTADFDPGAATFSLTSAGSYDVFVIKLNSAGSFVWAQSLGGSGFDVGYSVVVDLTSNVLVAGIFSETADFDPGPATSNLTSAGGTDVFVVKLNTSGGFVWAKRMGGSADDFGRSVAVDVSGNVLTTGYFNGTADFDPGAGTANISSAGSGDVFISKLDPTGNYLWARNIGGATFDNGNSIAIDLTGNVYTTGGFSGTVDFDPGAGTNNLTSAGSADIFISKLDPSGNFVEAKNMGGTLSDGGNSLRVDLSNNLYLTGDFRGTADFDPNAGTTNLTSAGDIDAYVMKISQGGSLPITLINAKAYEKNTGVQIEWSTVMENNVDRYEVEISQHGQHFNKIGKVMAKGNSNALLTYHFYNNNPLSGSHFYRLKTVDKSGEITYSPVMKISLRNGLHGITLYPNPVVGKTFNLSLNNLAKGEYRLSIINQTGQQVFNQVINHKGGNSTEIITLSNTLGAGTYQLTLLGEGSNFVRQVIKN